MFGVVHTKKDYRRRMWILPLALLAVVCFTAPTSQFQFEEDAPSPPKSPSSCRLPREAIQWPVGT